jgi:hypothetical protein
MNVFISYNRQTQALTGALVKDVEALGHTVWFDQELSGGQAWWDQILSMILRCDLFVFVLDPAGLKSIACKREYGYAADLRKTILPILVSEGVSTNLLPPALSQIEFVDYRNQDRTAAFRLARAFSTLPPAAALPDPLPVPPEAPISYLGSLAAKVEATSPLVYDEQSVLIFELKRGLRDRETFDDTRALLKMFRKRRDLIVDIADEIDELLTVPKPPGFEEDSQTRKSSGRLLEKSQKEKTVLELSQYIEGDTVQSASVRHWLIWGGVCLAIIAAGVGVYALLHGTREESISRLSPSVLLLANFISSGLLLGVYHQASRRCDYSVFIAVVGLTTLIVTVPFFWWEAVHRPVMLDFVFHPPVGYWILLIVPVLGALYAMHSYSRLRVSEVLPTYVHLPLQRSQLLLVIIGAFFYFKESPPPLKVFGIAIAFVPIVISLVQRSGAGSLNATVRALPIFWLAVVVVLGGFLQLSSKWALNWNYVGVPVLSFVVLSNLGSTLVCVGASLFSSVELKEARLTIALGLLGGFLNVATIVTLTTYLVKGDASIIYTVSAMGFLIPTALYQLLGTEAMPSKLDWVAYSCAVFAVIMLAS